MLNLGPTGNLPKHWGYSRRVSIFRIYRRFVKRRGGDSFYIYEVGWCEEKL